MHTTSEMDHSQAQTTDATIEIEVQEVVEDDLRAADDLRSRHISVLAGIVALAILLTVSHLSLGGFQIWYSTAIVLQMVVLVLHCIIFWAKRRYPNAKSIFFQKTDLWTGFLFFGILYLEISAQFHFFGPYIIALPHTCAAIVLLAAGIKPIHRDFLMTTLPWVIISRLISISKGATNPWYEWNYLVISAIVELKTCAAMALTLIRTKEVDSEKENQTSTIFTNIWPFVLDALIEIVRTSVSMIVEDRQFISIFSFNLVLLTISLLALGSTFAMKNAQDVLVRTVLPLITSATVVTIALTKTVESYGFLLILTQQHPVCNDPSPANPIFRALLRKYVYTISQMTSHFILLALSRVSRLTFVLIAVFVFSIHFLHFFAYLLPLTQYWCEFHRIDAITNFYNGMLHSLLSALTCYFLIRPPKKIDR